MHKSFSMQKAVKKVIWERDSSESYQRVKGKNCFSLYLHTCLAADFLGWELCTRPFLEAFSCSHECNKASQYAAHMVRRGFNFYIGSLIIKQNPGNTEPIFSLCWLLSSIIEWIRGWDGGSQEETALWCLQLTTHAQRWDKEMWGSISQPASNEQLCLAVLGSGVNS